MVVSFMKRLLVRSVLRLQLQNLEVSPSAESVDHRTSAMKSERRMKTFVEEISYGFLSVEPNPSSILLTNVTRNMSDLVSMMLYKSLDTDSNGFIFGLIAGNTECSLVSPKVTRFVWQ